LLQSKGSCYSVNINNHDHVQIAEEAKKWFPFDILKW
jgi:hypothetical protein